MYVSNFWPFKASNLSRFGPVCQLSSRLEGCVKLFYKWAIPGLFFFIFILFNTVDSKKSLLKFANDCSRTMEL